MADTETLKLAEAELERLIAVYRKQGLSDTEILRLLIDAYKAMGGALLRYP